MQRVRAKGAIVWSDADFSKQVDTLFDEQYGKKPIELKSIAQENKDAGKHMQNIQAACKECVSES
jgi:hypothetical protein